VIPPPVPERWEWKPQLFDLQEQGSFFDWFLVRQRGAPDDLFAADRSIVRVDHRGMWWLYRRRPGDPTRWGGRDPPKPPASDPRPSP
jgi:hypothetical protein